MTEEVQVQESLGQRMFHEVKTVEQGQKYILEIVQQIVTAREQCDALHAAAAAGQMPREAVEKAYRNLSVRYGQGLGALTTLMHCRVLNDIAYNEMRMKIDAAMLPKVIATVNP